MLVARSKCMRGLQLVITLAFAVAGCTCEPNYIRPSLNTVAPETHYPYQLREPLTTGNPMSSSGPQRVGPTDDYVPELREMEDPPRRLLGPPD